MSLGAERDFYRALVELGAIDAPAEFLARALALVVEATDARIGYLALGASPVAEPLWHHVAGPEDLDALRATVSATIAQRARGEVVLTHDAASDERFRDAASVRTNRIDQVLAGPFEGGVLYLQGRRVPAPFDDDHVRLVRAFVRHLGPLGRDLRWRARWSDDPTAPYRARLRLTGLAGRSRALARVFDSVQRIAPTDVTVLLTGPTGAGKTTLAAALHDNSPRRAGPFTAVNCAGLVKDRVRVELFGAEPGSFTGQVGRIDGYVKEARGGTLFLDEVGHLPADSQSSLLTFLDHQRYRPLNGKEQAGDTRILCASSQDLTDGARFLPELYHRLATVVIRVPSLAERVDDLPELVTQLVAGVAQRLRLPVMPVAPSGYAWLEQEPLTGNLRELANLLTGALLQAGASASAITAEHFAAAVGRPTPPLDDLEEVTNAVRRRHIRRVLLACAGNRAAAAEVLGLNRTTLYPLLEKYGLSSLPDTSKRRGRETKTPDEGQSS